MKWFKRKKVKDNSYCISTSYCLDCGGITEQKKSVYRKYKRPSEHRCACVSDSKKEE